MDTIVKNNAAAGFPANIEFVNFFDKQITELYLAWNDDSRGNEDYIVKGVRIVKSATTISLTSGIIRYSGELFLFAGAVLDTTDINKIELYVSEQVSTQQFGDLQNYPAYKYRTLLARVVDNGNMMTIHRNRTYITPIRESGKNIKISNLAGTIKHGEIEHTRNKITINATVESSAIGTGVVFIFPFATGQEIFDIYSRGNFKTYKQRTAGHFRVIQLDASGNSIYDVIGGDIIQENAMFYFYGGKDGKLTTSDITGIDNSQGAALPRPVVVMFEFNIIVD